MIIIDVMILLGASCPLAVEVDGIGDADASLFALTIILRIDGEAGERIGKLCLTAISLSVTAGKKSLCH